MISSKITELRKKTKLTEKELSKEIGMSLTGFRQAMEKDEFKTSTIISLAKTLNVPVGYFFDEIVLSSNVNQVANGNNNNISYSLNEFKHKIEILEKEIEGLKKEITNKDKIIKLLEGRV